MLLLNLLKNIWSAYYVLGTVLSAEDTVVNKVDIVVLFDGVE